MIRERPFWGGGLDFFSVEMLLWEELHTKLLSAAPHTKYQTPDVRCSPSRPLTPLLAPTVSYCTESGAFYVWDGKFKGRDTRESSLILSCSWDSLSHLQGAATAYHYFNGKQKLGALGLGTLVV